MYRTTRRLASLTALAILLAAAPLAGRASAQTSADRPATEAAPAYDRPERDRGFDYGWLGLLGLAGLAGLMPRKAQVVTTHRAGDSMTR